MQAEKANKLRKAWGNKPCDHPNFDHEYMKSVQTGDYICTQCGKCFTASDKEAIETARGKKE